MVNTFGSCQTGANRNLFFSPFLGRFDRRDVLDENPNSTEEEILEKQKQHRVKNRVLTEQAKAICASCPILAACTEYANSMNLPIYGVVAGMTEKERRARKTIEK